MMSIDLVEKMVEAFIGQDPKKLIDILEGYLTEAEKRGSAITAKRLRSLVAKVPFKLKSYTGSSVSSAYVSKYGTQLDSLVHFSDASVSLEDVVLEESNKKKIKTFINEWENKDRLRKHNLNPINKLIFYGPPGTGKTRLAGAIAHQLDYPLVVVRLDELISSFLGKTGKNIKDIFQIAEKESVVVFLDEIDTIAKNRDDSAELGELKRVVTVLLQNIDNFSNDSVLIAATNHEHILDKALWRRFQLKFSFELPNPEERLRLFEIFLDGYPLEKGCWELFSKTTSGLSGSDISDLCNQMKRRMVLSGDTKITRASFISELLVFLNTSGSNPTITKKDKYKLCDELKSYNFSLMEISHLSGIPYTTLNDNLSS